MSDKFGFEEIKQQIGETPESYEWNRQAVETALHDNRITKDEYLSLLHILHDKFQEVTGKLNPKASLEIAKEKLSILQSRNFHNYVFRFMHLSEYEKTITKRQFTSKKEVINSGEIPFADIIGEEGKSVVSALLSNSWLADQSTDWRESSVLIEDHYNVIQNILIKVREEVLEFKNKNPSEDKIKHFTITRIRDELLSFMNHNTTLWLALSHYNPDDNQDESKVFLVGKEKAREHLKSLVGEQIGEEILTGLVNILGNYKSGTVNGPSINSWIIDTTEYITKIAQKRSLLEGTVRELTESLNETNREEPLYGMFLAHMWMRANQVSLKLRGEKNLRLLKEFQENPDIIFEEGKLSLLLRAYTKASGRTEYMYWPYQVLMYIKGEAEDTESWGDLTHCLRDVDASVILGVKVLIPDKEITNKVFALASTGEQCAHPVFNFKGVLVWPRG